MEGREVGLREAVTKLTALREELGAMDLVAHWTSEFGDIDLVVDGDGHAFYVNDEHVPQHEAQ
jgi:hypothetical protein